MGSETCSKTGFVFALVDIIEVTSGRLLEFNCGMAQREAAGDCIRGLEIS